MRLLRCATALRVTAPPTLRLKALVWPKGSFRPGKPDPTPLFPRKQPSPSDRPGAVQGREAAKQTLNGDDRSGILLHEGKGGRCRRCLAQTSDFATRVNTAVFSRASVLRNGIAERIRLAIPLCNAR